MPTSSDHDIRSTEENHEEKSTRKKSFSPFTSTSMVVLSLFIVCCSLVFPEFQLRRYTNELRTGGAKVSSYYRTPAWLRKSTGTEFPMLEKVQGIDFSKYPATDQTLKSISNWPTLMFLRLAKAEISEEAVTNLLSHCPEINSLQIVNCPKISPAFIKKLKTKHLKIEIYFRGVAYLGVGGKTHPQGCRIHYVDSGMPADLAGIKLDEIIIAFDDQPIKTFDQLVHSISEHLPDETITIKLLRKEQELSLSCKLTGWRKNSW